VILPTVSDNFGIDGIGGGTKISFGDSLTGGRLNRTTVADEVVATFAGGGGGGGTSLAKANVPVGRR
jgi:hypothetical protein